MRIPFIGIVALISIPTTLANYVSPFHKKVKLKESIHNKVYHDRLKAQIAADRAATAVAISKSSSLKLASTTSTTSSTSSFSFASSISFPEMKQVTANRNESSPVSSQQPNQVTMTQSKSSKVSSANANQVTATQSVSPMGLTASTDFNSTSFANGSTLSFNLYTSDLLPSPAPSAACISALTASIACNSTVPLMRYASISACAKLY
jgi:hypothetical protein